MIQRPASAHGEGLALLLRLREPVSGLTHLVGALLSVAGLSVLVYVAAAYRTPWHIVAFSIFGASLILLYTASALYHLLPLSERGIQVMRRIDHIMIYVLIAGTYTPFCLVPLRGAWGWSMFGAIWALALAGIIKKLVWMQAPRWLSTAFYLVMGWLVVIATYPLTQSIAAGGVIWLFTGGLFYSAGAVIYATKRPNPVPGWFGFHEIWHLFVMAGSASHYWAVLRYLT